MFISGAKFANGIIVSKGDKIDPIRVQFGASDEGFAVYFSREDALDLYSQLEKAIHETV